MKSGRLFLLPSTIGDSPLSLQIPDYNIHIINNTSYFIVENVRTARRFLKLMNPKIEIEKLTLVELNEHTKEHEYMDFFLPVLNGKDAALVSEAGLPCVADPGRELVFLAHQLQIQVVPLVGPSSIMLALMASGFNGQNFNFHGYLPIEKNNCEQKLRELERLTWKNDQTQIFIETPYRNVQLIERIIRVCRSDSRLCVAANLLQKDEKIISQSIQEWKNVKENFHKISAVFLMYK